jgi:hypothetical protein
LFLFAGAFFLALGAVAALAPAFSGDWRAIAMFAGVGLSASMLGWLGMVLWSGRRIPKWFIASFGLLIVAGPVVAVLFSGTWMESLAIFGMVIPSALGFQSVLRNYPGTPPKPKTFDEL